jgi:HPt (histidine-containing phosphotransfer) domain-containing protein
MSMQNYRYCAIDPHFLLKSAGDDLDLFRELSTMFVRLAEPVLARLEMAIQEGNDTATCFESHSLKGSTALIGAVELSALLSQIEHLARSARTDLVSPCLPELRRLFDLAIGEVRFSISHFDGQPDADAEQAAP